MSNVYAPPGANVDDVQRGGAAITAGMIEALRGTKTWVLIVGILLLLGALLTGLGGLAMMVGMGFAGAANKGMPGGTAAMLGIGLFYLIFAVVYVFLGMYLLQYSGACSKVVKDAQPGDLEAALNYQRKFWRLGGMMALIGLVLGILGIVAAIAIPAFMAAGAGR
ncbi:MAG: hypothetical protein JNM76_07320 [Betaproteobacteria bacterium]|nr:hypothetical protein [Betaproteobacteria bacterium]